jgi:hypothetical protein
MYIYDPSYTPPETPLDAGERRRLKDIMNIRSVTPLIQGLRAKKLRVDGVYYGGGGNNDDRCTAMAFQWIRSEVIKCLVERWPAAGPPEAEICKIPDITWEPVRL